MNNKSKLYKLATALTCTTLLFACTNNEANPDTALSSENQTETEVTETVATPTNTSIETVNYSEDDYYSEWSSENPTYIELNGTSASYDGPGGVVIEDNIIAIRTSGVYVLSGTLDDGQIMVDAEDKANVRLILNGVDITSKDSAAINIVQAEKTIISLEAGTENILTDGSAYVYEDDETDEPDAALFSKDDLTINGTGSLTVQGSYNDGIAGNDDLKIVEGTIVVDAVDDGIIGRDLLAVKDGSFTITASGDGLKASNDEDAEKGNIAIEAGTFAITAGSDGAQAEASVMIAGGEYTIVSGGGSANGETHTAERGGFAGQTTATTDSETASTKGIKAVADVTITGGTFNIDAADDGLHSNDTLTVAGGDFTIATGDDAVHADTSIVTTGGIIDVTKSYEGIESQQITIEDGTIHIVASDDGINIGGGNDGSGLDMGGSTNGKLMINGGYIVLRTSGDGLDSNGSIEMTSGTVIVNGPTESMNGAIDYDGSFEMTGGTLIAAGSSGMTQGTSDSSTQNGVLMTYSETQAAGTILHLEDSNGEAVVTFVPEKDYQSVFISSSLLAQDGSYTLYTGGSSTGSEADGVYTGGVYQAGTKVVDFTISETVTWLNESGITTGGGAGGFGGAGAPAGGANGIPADGGQRPARDGADGAGMLSDMDQETREQVEAIMEQQRNGTINQEEAQAQLAELGVDFPIMGGRPN
ncbi:carbohydrate-binding domain-containing protein [Radiobacillus sp. PE A8.2]|uniref:carbohydrate-binding domain-containing protein n=1 Tax=Radiobacillus sp. PE A8.2 TaxID=3380349 RepID=UPI00388FFB8C